MGYRNRQRLRISGIKKTSITDSAAKLAAEYGLDISLITPTGAKGNIIKKDVITFLESNPVPEPVTAETTPAATSEEE